MSSGSTIPSSNSCCGICHRLWSLQAMVDQNDPESDKNDPLVITRCGHIFHRLCIRHTVRNKCPVCQEKCSPNSLLRLTVQPDTQDDNVAMWQTAGQKTLQNIRKNSEGKQSSSVSSGRLAVGSYESDSTLSTEELAENAERHLQMLTTRMRKLSHRLETTESERDQAMTGYHEQASLVAELERKLAEIEQSYSAFQAARQRLESELSELRNALNARTKELAQERERRWHLQDKLNSIAGTTQACIRIVDETDN